jgi:Spy/CpxP family protein refolding chaperone
MKKILLSLISVVILSSTVFAEQNNISTENDFLSSKEIKSQLHKIKTKRIIISNALLLDDSQKQQANQIYSKISEKEAILIVQLKREEDILKEMQEQNENSLNIKKQKNNIDSLKSALNDIDKEADNEFKKILTKQQKTKFKRLKKEVVIYDF